jgi:hypothetical protein
MGIAQLPFPRGQTASCGISIAGPTGLVSQLPSATGYVGEATAYRPDLAGKVFDATDTVLGTNAPMRLRPVQAHADITVACKCVQFSTTAGEFGAVTADTAIPSSGTAGLIAKPIDPAYTVGQTISKYDWFYVVEEGPATLIVGTTTTAQGSIMCDADGCAAPATAGEAVIGVSEIAVTATGTATARVWIKNGLQSQVPDAAS